MSNVQKARRAGQEAARVRALESARARVLRMSEPERRALAHEFFALSSSLKDAEQRLGLAPRAQLSRVASHIGAELAASADEAKDGAR